MRYLPICVGVLLAAGCTDPVSQGADGGAMCEATCSPGARRCADGQVQFCADYDGDGCGEWGGDAACPAGQACAEGQCVSQCESECTAGAAVCGQGGVRSCILDGAGCLRLSDPVACAADERCDNGACVPSDQPCEDACPQADMRRCAAEGFERCGDFDEDPCLEWSGALPCEGDTACAEGECVPRCADECAGEERRCAGDAVESCGNFDADLCLEYGPATPCGDAERCDDGACVPADQECEDACEEEGGSVCNGEGAYQRCGQYDADPCLDLSSPIDCGPLERCMAGVCLGFCENECAAGSSRCGEGGQRLTCGNFDGDPCLEFGGAMPCPNGEICDNGLCTPDDQPCEDLCVRGEARCGAEGVESCGDFDDDDCLEWSAPAPCPPGERCVEAGQCELECDDECQPGERACRAAQVVQCGDFDDDACREFGMAAACPMGQSCVDGACQQMCEDECAIGQTRCSDDGRGVERCGPSALDDCLHWGSPSPCGAREACEGGACVAICADECDVGDRRCNADGFETCGDFDADPCLEYGGGASCGLGEACEDGVCNGVCDDECGQPDETQCVDPSAAQVCGNFDGDPCLEWSAPQPCPPGTECLGFDCAEAEAPPIVINELYYDSPGGDRPNVFIELHGPAGAPLEGLRLVGVNGSNGQRYQSIELVGMIGADGYFVVATPEANDDLRPLVDQFAADADYQNGADAVVLLFGEQHVDGVAYGDGAPEIGEGAPAPDVRSGESLSRDAAHTDTNDNLTDFAVSEPTPGE